MTLPQNVRDQVVGYVRHQGAKSLAELAELVKRTGAECAEALRDVSEEQASFASNDEWSIKNVLAHLIESMTNINREIANLASSQPTKPVPGLGLWAETGQSIEDLRQELAALWADTARLAASLPEDGDAQATREHPWFGPLNYRDWIVFQRLHARDHMQQIESIKTHPDYPKARSTSSGQE